MHSETIGSFTRSNGRTQRLAALNPGVTLPSQDIIVVHRSDGSGTTYVWTDYLTTVSPEWAKQVGRAKDVKWPERGFRGPRSKRGRTIRCALRNVDYGGSRGSGEWTSREHRLSHFDH